MNETVREVVRVYAKRLYEVQTLAVPINAKKKSIDIECRIVSDFIGTENSEVSHSTPHIIKNCKWWSKAAVDLYNSLDGSHSTRCEHRKYGKRAFAVEHEYPLGIIKNMIVNCSFNNPQQVEDFLWKYGKITIVTEEENRMLTISHKTALTIEEAEKRYKLHKIEVGRFDGYNFIQEEKLATITDFFCTKVGLELLW